MHCGHIQKKETLPNCPMYTLHKNYIRFTAQNGRSLLEHLVLSTIINNQEKIFTVFLLGNPLSTFKTMHF